MQPPDHGGRGPKRLAVDPVYRARLEVADDHKIALSEFAEWAPDDQDAAIGLRLYRGECCSSCSTHPSVWNPELGGDRNAVVPVWKHCRVCELIEQARDAGPPTEDKGWHLTLQHNH